MQEVKKQLRRELTAKRREMSRADKTTADKAVFECLKPYIDRAGSVFTYVSTDIEVDTCRVLEYCFEKGISVATPVSGDTELTFYYVKSYDDLSVGRFGILEPTNRETAATADKDTLCIVPALCADGKGYRLGYGRGYYDRFLESFIGCSIIICYSDFRREVPTEPHDKRAHFTIFDDTVMEVI